MPCLVCSARKFPSRHRVLVPRSARCAVEDDSFGFWAKWCHNFCCRPGLEPGPIQEKQTDLRTRMVPKLAPQFEFLGRSLGRRFCAAVRGNHHTTTSSRARICGRGLPLPKRRFSYAQAGDPERHTPYKRPWITSSPKRAPRDDGGAGVGFQKLDGPHAPISCRWA